MDLCSLCYLYFNDVRSGSNGYLVFMDIHEVIGFNAFTATYFVINAVLCILYLHL